VRTGGESEELASSVWSSGKACWSPEATGKPEAETKRSQFVMNST